MATIFDDTGEAPEFLLDWFQSGKDDRDPNAIGWRSVTELIGPPKPKLIEQRLGDSLQIPATTRLDAMIGDAVHRDIARFVTKRNRARSEMRLVVSLGGKKISGQMDAIEDGILYDFKTRKAYQHAKGYKTEDEIQLNCYAFICSQHNIDIKEAKIISLCKNKSSYDTFNSYEMFDVPLWSSDEQRDYLLERIKIHQVADDNYYQFGALPTCSDEERWQTQTTYKVRRKDWDEEFKNGKRDDDKAFRIKSRSGRSKMYSEDEAQEHIDSATPSMKKLLFIEEIKGNFMRCESYCDVRDYCLQNNPLAPKTQELIDANV